MLPAMDEASVTIIFMYRVHERYTSIFIIRFKREFLIRYSGSQPFLVLCQWGNILSIKYPLTVIMSTVIRNIPIIIVLLR